MKNETKQDDSQGIKQKLPTRNPRQQEESQSADAIAWGRPTVAPYDRGPWVTVEMPELDYVEYLGRMNRAAKNKIRSEQMKCQNEPAVKALGKFKRNPIAVSPLVDNTDTGANTPGNKR